MFMKYFTYHYMNPRNKQYNDRDVGPDPRRDDSSSLSVNTAFGSTGQQSWDSNAYGYNINELANFFERIDYVIYHGNKAVQYSLINPVLTRFRTGDIDYASSDVMEFDMTFEYESFTIYEQVNFGLSEFDINRFENASGFKGPAFVPIGKPILLEERRLQTLSGDDEFPEYVRTFQEQPTNATNPSSEGAVTPSDTQSPNPATAPPTPPVGGSPAEAQAAANEAAAVTSEENVDEDITVTGPRGRRLPPVYGDRANIVSPVEKNKSFIGGLLGSIADNALSAAINGTSIKNAVINTAVGGAVQGITNVVQAPRRPAKTQPDRSQETGAGSTAETAPVTPAGGS
jgi:hypothetical protein